MLKVLTYLKEIFPALWNSISFLYIPSGVLPVGSPSTKNLSGPGWKSLMRFSTYLADHSPTSLLLSRITRRILAKTFVLGDYCD